MQIYLARNNVQAGPYSLAQVNAMLANGQVDFSDLMWHAGLPNWQTVGELTHNNRYYNPPIIQTAAAPNSVNLDKSASNTANNPQVQPISQPTSQPSQPTQHHQPKWVQERTSKGKDIAHAQKQLELASVGSRIIAKLLDFGLFIIASLPLYLAFYNSPNFDKFMKMAESGKTMLSSSEVNQLLAGIPQSTMILTDILVLGLLVAQMLLLTRRGQTIGKMAMGIRILDMKSNALPRFTNLILLRTILPSIIYSLSVVGLLFLIADLVVMLSNDRRQSIHDKMAGTYVVIANDNQVTPLPVEPTV